MKPQIFLKTKGCYETRKMHIRLFVTLATLNYEGIGVESCVCSTAFKCGSTLIKILLLHAGTVKIPPHIFESDVTNNQSNKQKTHYMNLH